MQRGTRFPLTSTFFPASSIGRPLPGPSFSGVSAIPHWAMPDSLSLSLSLSPLSLSLSLSLSGFLSWHRMESCCRWPIHAGFYIKEPCHNICRSSLRDFALLTTEVQRKWQNGVTLVMHILSALHCKKTKDVIHFKLALIFWSCLIYKRKYKSSFV